MVELLVLDGDFQLIDIIDDFSSLTWRRSYYNTGGFDLYLNGQYFDLIRRGKYIYRKDAIETGIISSIDYTHNIETSSIVKVSGKFLKSILGNLVLDQVQRLKGKHEDVMRALVNKIAVSGNTKRRIPRLQLGVYKGLGSIIEQQATGDNLLDKLHEIGATAELGCRIRYDYLTNIMLFEVYQGLDRTEGQAVNSWATFSTDFENLLDLSYTYNDEDCRNFAYVAGEGEAEERILIEVDRTSGGARKELYVDARDLSMQKEDNTTMTLPEYQSLLIQRGLEKLSEYQKVEAVNSSIDPNSNLIYKQDYNLGDKCTICDKGLGISLQQRITEIEEVYEAGKMKITPVFGDGYLTINDKLKREVKK